MKNTSLNSSPLSHLLASGIVRVEFVKQNGDTRIMDCTKNPALIPPASHPKTHREAPDGLNIVWDCGTGGWRSFYSDSVVTINAL